MPHHRVILDTDIGDDIDDSFALALLLRSPEIELLGVVTVMGDVADRVSVAAELCAAAGRAPDITRGCSATFALRPNKAAPRHLLYRAPNAYQEGDDSPDGFLQLYRAADHPLPIAIGPLTNVAMALTYYGNRRPRRMIVMGGEFQREGFIEHNIRCDPEAAHLVFSSGNRIDVIPWSIGPATKLDESDLRRLFQSENKLVVQLVKYLRAFWQHMPGKTNMYDPMTVVALLRPELFEWRTGRVTVELWDEKLYGLTRFTPDEAGPHRVAFGVDAAAAKEFMLDRLLNE